MKKIIYIISFLFCTNQLDAQVVDVTTKANNGDTILAAGYTKSKITTKKSNPVLDVNRKKSIIKKGDLTYLYDPKLKRYILLEKKIIKNQ